MVGALCSLQHGSTAAERWTDRERARAVCRPRGWARLGAAQLCLGHHRAAESAYQSGLALDAGSAEMQLGLQLAQAAAAGRGKQRRAAMHD